MLRALTGIALALSLTLAPTFASAAPKKHPVHRHHVRKHARHDYGYGFLPGYRPPHVVEYERAVHYWRSGPHYYGPAWPRYYRGRWNGGGFGPCYVYTPIGYMWTCGK